MQPNDNTETDAGDDTDTDGDAHTDDQWEASARAELPRTPTADDLEIVDTTRLHPHPRNPRRGDVPSIRTSMRAHGVVDVCVAQRSTGAILGGNHRWEAANAEHAPTVPVLWVDCDDDEALEILLVLNATADRATYDVESLAAAIEELRSDDPLERLTRSGWSADAADRVMRDLAQSRVAALPKEPPADFDAAAELTAEWGTAQHQLWSIRGQHEHRLLIDDAADGTAPSRLLDGASIDLIVTSPPYNVGVNYGTTDKQKADDKKWPAYRDFLLGCLRPWVDHVADGRCVAWNVGVSHKTFHPRQVVMFEDDLALTFWRMLTWLKVGIPIPTWQVTVNNPRARSFHPNWTHELVYLFVKGAREPAYGDRLDMIDDTFKNDTFTIAQNQANVGVPATSVDAGQTIPSLNPKGAAHPAVFPVALPAGLATHLADVDAIVFDPYIGAGSTILACEQRHRRGYGTELDPGYAAIALHRAKTLGMTCERID